MFPLSPHVDGLSGGECDADRRQRERKCLSVRLRERKKETKMDSHVLVRVVNRKGGRDGNKIEWKQTRTEGVAERYKAGRWNLSHLTFSLSGISTTMDKRAT